MAERTGCPVFTDLWSYVLVHMTGVLMYFDRSACFLPLPMMV
jgi:hypothetical protein